MSLMSELEKNRKSKEIEKLSETGLNNIVSKSIVFAKTMISFIGYYFNVGERKTALEVILSNQIKIKQVLEKQGNLAVKQNEFMISFIESTQAKSDRATKSIQSLEFRINEQEKLINELMLVNNENQNKIVKTIRDLEVRMVERVGAVDGLPLADTNKPMLANSTNAPQLKTK